MDFLLVNHYTEKDTRFDQNVYIPLGNTPSQVIMSVASAYHACGSMYQQSDAWGYPGHRQTALGALHRSASKSVDAAFFL